MPITRVLVVGLLHEAQRFVLTARVFILVFFYVYFFTEHPFRANPLGRTISPDADNVHVGLRKHPRVRHHLPLPPGQVSRSITIHQANQSINPSTNQSSKSVVCCVR